MVGPRAAAGAYGRSFWLCFVANTMLTVAVSLLYRYADFVTYLGGGEFELGLIVGVGTVGGLLMRASTIRVPGACGCGRWHCFR
jgi:hypothetical protein